jgi:hypothetical protein
MAVGGSSDESGAAEVIPAVEVIVGGVEAVAGNRSHRAIPIKGN